MSSAGRAILLTPPGMAALAVVRVAGPGVASFLSAHFSRPVPPGRCVHGVLSDGATVIDDPVVVVSGEGSIADISLHGGSWVVQSALKLVQAAGFEIVNSASGPLPAEAVDGADAFEREMLQYLPLARTELAVRVLLAQPRAWRELLSNLPVAKGEAQRLLEDRSLHWLLHPPRVALVGAPNVGKSTLANQLFGQERSITADLPGTTRDWVGEIANIDGLAVTLVDTPGVRVTADTIEGAAIGAAIQEIKAADLVVVVLDVSIPFGGAQEALVGQFPNAVRVVNKMDLPHNWPSQGMNGVFISAQSGQGIDALQTAILEHFDCRNLNPSRPRCWTERQRLILQGSFVARASCP